jgi:hypothetical protein
VSTVERVTIIKQQSQSEGRFGLPRESCPLLIVCNLGSAPTTWSPRLTEEAIRYAGKYGLAPYVAEIAAEGQSTP